MNARQILATGGSLCLLILAVTAYQSCTRLASAPVELGGQLAGNYRWTLTNAAAALRQWSGNQVTVTVQSDTLGVRPIGELALARVRVRSIVDYSSAAFGSTKRIIAHEAFDVKLGWDVNTDLTLTLDPARHTVRVQTGYPHVLSVTHADREPTVLYTSDGLLNKLTPEDMMTVQRQLEGGARTGEEVRQGAATAEENLRRYFEALFALQGYTVIMDFSGTRLSSPTAPDHP
jgi:hypothetical protein